MVGSARAGLGGVDRPGEPDVDVGARDGAVGESGEGAEAFSAGGGETMWVADGSDAGE